MSAQSLLHSVFSCSSPASGSAASTKGFSKRKLRQTRSLDPALIGGCGGEAGMEGGSRGATGGRLCSQLSPADAFGSRSASSPRGPHPRANRLPPPRPLCSSFSTPSTPQEKSPSGSFHFDYEVPLGRSGLKKSMVWDLPSVLAGPGSGRSAILCSSGGGPNGIFASPRRWLQQRKFQSPPDSHHGQPYVVWKSEGDFTWNSMSGRSVRLRSVPIQSLSELERARLQEVAFYQLQQDCDLSCQITIPKGKAPSAISSGVLQGNRPLPQSPSGTLLPAPPLTQEGSYTFQVVGLQTVGIFRVGSSKKRVRQLREEFDRGVDVSLEEEHSVHDVAALLKEFLRDMPDPLLTRELYTAFINTLLLEPEEQLSTLQLLIYLLPPCNCDTLHRLLQFLSIVARHAEDDVSKDGQEVTGNKMTSLNLATIFGPNLLHKQKSSDKEFSVQSSARAEESTAIIAVVQKMIENYEALFMVPPDRQNEVLISLLETDPDVVDYLLRRKASQSSSPDMLRSEVSFSMGGRHSSTDSNKASSGDLSPYDNNSPVLSERSLLAMQEDVAPGGSEKLYKGPEQYVLVGHLPSSKSRESSPGPRLGKDMAEEAFNIWGTWHSTLKSGSKDPGMTGSYGDIFESSSLRPGPCSLSQGNLSPNWPRWQGGPADLDGGAQGVRRTQTASAVAGCGAHAPVSRVCSTPHIRGGGGAEQPAPRPRPEQCWTLSGAQDVAESEPDVAWPQRRAKPPSQRPGEGAKHDKRPPPPYPGPGKQASAAAHQPAEPPLWRPQRPEEGSGTALEEGSQTAEREHQAAQQKVSSVHPGPSSDQNSKTLGDPNWLDWQRERWQIWELLSTDNPDALPETLV
ncbi:rho GTPase-activating protein 6 [Camelus ferus]|uniref:Rho GTPase-activating protein 36 n=1 Tax=Camelus ferus TaxID=419612 RepID=A0A8B8SP66_CAMFR|nr:rho GTPase-activating protein 6 [Camelus ferus]